MPSGQVERHFFERIVKAQAEVVFHFHLGQTHTAAGDRATNPKDRAAHAQQAAEAFNRFVMHSDDL